MKDKKRKFLPIGTKIPYDLPHGNPVLKLSELGKPYRGALYVGISLGPDAPGSRTGAATHVLDSVGWALDEASDSSSARLAVFRLGSYGLEAIRVLQREQQRTDSRGAQARASLAVLRKALAEVEVPRELPAPIPLSLSPDPVARGGTLTISYSALDMAGETIEVELEDGENPPSVATVQIELDANGEGSADWVVPSDWGHAVVAAYEECNAIMVSVICATDADPLPTAPTESRRQKEREEHIDRYGSPGEHSQWLTAADSTKN